MEKNLNHFEVRITDIRTGEEKYVGLSNCIFLVAYEDRLSTRLLSLSQCDLLTKAACYSAAEFGLKNVFEEEPILAAIVKGLSEFPPVFREDV